MEILRYAAFSTDPAGGNPAGVVLDASGATDAQMQQVAADVGFSETAFLVGVDMGRPSLLTVDVPAGSSSGIAVTGVAVRL